jgi:hypothetical protein
MNVNIVNSKAWLLISLWQETHGAYPNLFGIKVFVVVSATGLE